MDKSIITYNKLKEICSRKGYTFYTGDLNLNMIGVRTSNRAANNYDDFFCLAYEKEGTSTLWINNKFTTDPGIYYLQREHFLSPKGCGILAEGQYPGMWKIGLHGVHKYEAFVQVGKCKAYRDRNNDNILEFDPSTIEEGIFGCDQHHGYNTAHVDNNSAMCQVHENIFDLAIPLGLAKQSIPFHGDRFTYTLLNESDFK